MRRRSGKHKEIGSEACSSSGDPRLSAAFTPSAILSVPPTGNQIFSSPAVGGRDGPGDPGFLDQLPRCTGHPWLRIPPPPHPPQPAFLRYAFHSHNTQLLQDFLPTP